MKRIIPISSGKGGVGKTSFAVNLALRLSEFGRTILIDLDTGTSSIRTVIGAKVRKDLYHFFKRDEPLHNCITGLPADLDPNGQFRRFGFIASPMHMINSITNLNQAYRNKLIDAINNLVADFIILDLRAGLDPTVTDFMPLSNTGILVFTPNHPAATLSASDIVKAVLFRKLREVFFVGSPIYQYFDPRVIQPRKINQMIDLAEDYYHPEIPNLDAFMLELNAMVPGHTILKILARMIEEFRVYYVLNRFNGVETSFQTAIKPFVQNITQNISSRLTIQNLGWVIESQRYHEANIQNLPYVLRHAMQRQKVQTPKPKTVDQRLEELYRLGGLRKDRPAVRRPQSIKEKTKSALADQLDAIESLFTAKKKEDEWQNFNYIMSCMRYLIKNNRPADFGETRILKQGELMPLKFGRGTGGSD